MAKRKRKYWSFSVGPRGCCVRVYERSVGNIRLVIHERGQKPRYEGLDHQDRGKAVETARERQAQLALGLTAPHTVPTLGVTLDAFVARQRERAAAGDMKDSTLKEQERAVDFWKQALGADTDPTKITPADLEHVTLRRATGALDPRGKPVPEAKRRPVRTRAVGADLEVLRAALRWAVHEKRLFRDNVMEGRTIEKEASPRRPVATADRYDATRAKADRIPMELRGDGKRVQVPSWLPELLDLVYATGARVGAITKLQVSDVLLTATEDAPYGQLHWRADSDKIKHEWQAPINQRARQAVDRILVDREVGLRAKWPDSPWLFPSPRNPRKPLSVDLASDWLLAAEALAELPKLDGSLWHAYRRGWATARKHYPLADVAAAGGWKDTTTLRTIYTQSDPATVRKVVLEPAELRDLHG